VGEDVLQGLTKLLELQRLDDQLVASRTEHEGLPARREGNAQGRQACDDRLAAAKLALRDAELAMRQAEGALQEQEALLERFEGQQFQVKSNDAYTALLAEMEHAREGISEHETKILENMETIERATSELAEAERESGSAHSAFDAEDREIQTREADLTASIERLSGERAKLGPEIERELLNQYERIAKRRRPAVVLVKEELCGGCRVGIPPQTFIEIQRCEQIVTCANCARILLHEERVGSQLV
jgi:predicted  nucleic acid-binding Zn-ribbon protein